MWEGSGSFCNGLKARAYRTLGKISNLLEPDHQVVKTTLRRQISKSLASDWFELVTLELVTQIFFFDGRVGGGTEPMPYLQGPGWQVPCLTHTGATP